MFSMFNMLIYIFGMRYSAVKTGADVIRETLYTFWPTLIQQPLSLTQQHDDRVTVQRFGVVERRALWRTPAESRGVCKGIRLA